MIYRVGDRSAWTFEQWTDLGQTAPVDATPVSPFSLRRVRISRSTISPRLTRPAGTSLGGPLVLTRVAPCRPPEPSPADFWEVEVNVALWGPGEAYQIEVELAALFEVQPCTTLRAPLLDRLAREGAERLHQMARQHVRQATLYGPWGPCDIGPLALQARQDPEHHLATDARAVGYWVARQCQGDPYEELESEHVLAELSLTGERGRAALELATLLGYVSYDEEEGICSPLLVSA